MLKYIGSPFKVPVQGEVDASKVTASGPGVDPNNCRATNSLSFKMKTKKSAKAPLGVEISTDKGPIADKPIIKDNNDGTYDVSYKPPPEGSPCNVKVTYGGKDIKGRYVFFFFSFEFDKEKMNIYNECCYWKCKLLFIYFCFFPQKKTNIEIT